MSVCFWGNFFIFALLIGLKDENYQINTIVELPVAINSSPSPESFFSGNSIHLILIPQMKRVTLME